MQTHSHALASHGSTKLGTQQLLHHPAQQHHALRSTKRKNDVQANVAESRATVSMPLPESFAERLQKQIAQLKPQKKSFALVGVCGCVSLCVWRGLKNTVRVHCRAISGH